MPNYSTKDTLTTLCPPDQNTFVSRNTVKFNHVTVFTLREAYIKRERARCTFTDTSDVLFSELKTSNWQAEDDHHQYKPGELVLANREKNFPGLYEEVRSSRAEISQKATGSERSLSKPLYTQRVQSHVLTGEQGIISFIDRILRLFLCRSSN